MVFLHGYFTQTNWLTSIFDILSQNATFFRVIHTWIIKYLPTVLLLHWNGPPEELAFFPLCPLWTFMTSLPRSYNAFYFSTYAGKQEGEKENTSCSVCGMQTLLQDLSQLHLDCPTSKSLQRAIFWLLHSMTFDPCHGVWPVC